MKKIFNRIFFREGGEINMIAIVLIILVVLVLVVIFKDKMKEMLESIFMRMKGEVNKI